ncbi:ATP-binding protein [Streptomyces sp. NPDC052727]|uniref:ATP-binding protein n=1 Tax=Streptomyces sp. NPDC052727 TaxID=3154854 RepID=UPI00341F1EF7
MPAGRDFLGKALGTRDCVGAADDPLLLLSEILTNAVQHAQGPIGVHACRTDTDLTVEISDRSPHLPQRAWRRRTRSPGAACCSCGPSPTTGACVPLTRGRRRGSASRCEHTPPSHVCRAPSHRQSSRTSPRRPGTSWRATASAGRC